MPQVLFNEYNAALARAEKRNIQVCGCGVRHDGARVYATTSGSETNRWHLVAVVNGRLHCDCPSRVYCTHRAVVRQRIASEMQAKRAAEMTARDAIRATAPLHRDNKAFSLFRAE